MDVPTLRGGVAEGRRCILNLAEALLGDVIDLTPHLEAEAAGSAGNASSGGAGGGLSSSNIVAAPYAAGRAARAATARLWQRYTRG